MFNRTFTVWLAALCLALGAQAAPKGGKAKPQPSAKAPEAAPPIPDESHTTQSRRVLEDSVDAELGGHVNFVLGPPVAERNRTTRGLPDSTTFLEAKALRPKVLGNPVPEPKLDGPTAEIVGREPEMGALDRDLFDDVVAVLRGGQLICTGVVVAPRLVVTARHCAPADSVVVGTRLSLPREIVTVTQVVEPAASTADVAVMRLSAALHVRPRGFHRSPNRRPPSGFVRLVGFGSNSTTGHGGLGQKRFADIPVAGWGCDALRSRRFGCAPGLELLVPAGNGRDTCRGDSGGPALELVDGRWLLLGVTSRALPGGRRACGDGGIYTRVDQIAGWLDEMIKGNK